MISMTMTATIVCGIAVDVVDIAGAFLYCFFHVDAVAGGAVAHDALDAPRDICAAMFMTFARRFVIISCFVSFIGGGVTMRYDKDYFFRIWDVSTQQQVAVLTGHTGGVTSIAFDVSGKYLASGDLMVMIT